MKLSHLRHMYSPYPAFPRPGVPYFICHTGRYMGDITSLLHALILGVVKD